jgi:catechol 2,3-dioxygenase-like lactoylglutathione lyase family enzyme
MTVIKVADWQGTLAWYVETLGLLPVLTDAEHRFVLLAAGNGRLALQGDPGAGPQNPRSIVRLVFQVPDVDQVRGRLIDKGHEVGLPIDNVREGYREIRLSDPEGTPVSLFSWIGSPQERRSSSATE